MIDSSDVGTGAVLVQEASDGLDHPFIFFYRNCENIKKKYSVVEKETSGLVLALDHFDIYLGLTPFRIKVYTDNSPLSFLKTIKNKNKRLVRWILTLQEYGRPGLIGTWGTVGQSIYWKFLERECYYGLII